MESQRMNVAPLTVEELREAIIDILGPAVRAEVSRDAPDARISGFVAHPAFRGLAPSDRRRTLMEPLHSRLGPRSPQVGPLFFLSPEEYEETFGEPMPWLGSGPRAEHA